MVTYSRAREQPDQSKSDQASSYSPYSGEYPSPDSGPGRFEWSWSCWQAFPQAPFVEPGPPMRGTTEGWP